MSSLKKFLFRFFIFFIPIILCLAFFEYKLRTKHFVSSYATKKYYLEQQLYSVETLVLGSSQTFHGINPSCFKSKTFNLANVSQTLYYDKRLTLLYLPKLQNLKTVIINISYFSFFYQMYDIKENWRDDYYLQHFRIKYYQYPAFRINNFSAIANYQPKHTLKLALNNFEDADAKAILQNGYLPKYRSELINDSSGLERVKIHNDENFIKRRKEIEEDLEDFIKQLYDKRIKIIFLTTPVFTSYSKFCDKSIIAANTNYINNICNKYNCRYLNFFEDSSFTKLEFYDNDHLNFKGADKLSKMVDLILQ